MTQVMRILSSLLGSSLPSSTTNQTSCRPSVSRKAHLVTVSQLESGKCSDSSLQSSRRNFILSTAVLTAAVDFVQQPEALAAKRKPPPPPEEKKGEDEKYLSAYDAKLLANARRKDALKALVESQKQKAKTASNIEAPREIFGQEPNSKF